MAIFWIFSLASVIESWRKRTNWNSSSRDYGKSKFCCRMDNTKRALLTWSLIKPCRSFFAVGQVGWESCSTTWLKQKFPLFWGEFVRRGNVCAHTLGWVRIVIQFFLLVPKQELNADFPITWREMNTILIFVLCRFHECWIWKPEFIETKGFRVN